MANLLYYGWISVLISALMLSAVTHAYEYEDDDDDVGEIGVNYGLLGNNLPQPREVVRMYRQYDIDKMRIFAPYREVLRALEEDGRRYGKDKCIYLYVGTRNEDLAMLAGSADEARKWVTTNILPYRNICFKYVTAGNEVLPGVQAASVAPAIRNLRRALDSFGYYDTLVSTVVHSAVLGASYPPSAGTFSNETVRDMTAILREISLQRNCKLMINVYPYFAYVGAKPGTISLDYALFRSSTPQVIDVGNNNLPYYNLFDAMVDGFYFAMEKAGFENIGVTITESGWPSSGNGEDTTVALARQYNSNLKNRFYQGMGTPKRPSARLKVFIFAMFNENQKPGPETERNFGIFFPNKTPVYNIF